MPKGEAVNSLWKYFGLSSTAIPAPTGGVEERLEMLTSQIEAMRSERKVPIGFRGKVSITDQVAMLFHSLKKLLGDSVVHYQIDEENKVVVVNLDGKPSERTGQIISDICEEFGFDVLIDWEGKK